MLKLITLLSFLFLGACTGSYSFQMFTYPSDVPPHESGWLYRGKIVTVDPYGVSPTEPVEKSLIVSIETGAGNTILSDEMKITGGTFQYEVTWQEKEELLISIFGLVPKSEEPIKTLTYHFNGKTFVPKNT